MPGPTAKIQRPVMFGLEIMTFTLAEPRIDWFPQDVSSQPIRWGDPVKQVAGGSIQRAAPSDTALLGLAAVQAANALPISIATMPIPTDTLGRTMVPVYLADASTQFRAQCSSAPAQSHILQTHDLQYAIPDASAPTPVITNGGTAGSTSYTYKIAAATIHGETALGTSGATSTGNATLSATNYNIITIPAVTNAVNFNIYKYNGSTYDYIATVPAAASGNTVFNDTGLAALSNGAVAANTTGWMINLAATSTNVVQVRALDTTPLPPYGAASNMVIWSIPAAKSQVQTLSGS